MVQTQSLNKILVKPNKPSPKPKQINHSIGLTKQGQTDTPMTQAQIKPKLNEKLQHKQTTKGPK